MTKKLIILLLMAACTNIAYATDFITFKRSSQSDIELTGTSDTITYDPLDWKGGRMAVENARQGYVDTFNEYTKENNARSKVLKPLPRPASDIYLSGTRQRMRSEVFDNLRWLSIDLDIPTEGNHTVKVVMIDPEIVVEKLVINPDNEHPSYHGKE